MAMAMLARALSLRRANQRARRKAANHPCAPVGDSAMEFSGGAPLSPEQTDYIHSSRVSQSIDALYVLSCLRDGLSLADAFTADEDASAPRLSLEDRLTGGRSSVSLSSDHGACGSESAWDRGFSSSSPSSRSDSTIGSVPLPIAKAQTTRSCRKADQNAKNSEDFCLFFRTDKRQQPLLSPSPPAAEGVTSDCCSFLQMGRRSSHGEEDVRGIARKERQSTGAAGREVNPTLSQKGEKAGSERPRLEAGKGDMSRRCKQLLQDEAGEDVKRLMRKGAMEAVEKQSGNAYQDFRESMLEMMVAGCCCGQRQVCMKGANDAEKLEKEQVLSRPAGSCNSSVGDDDDEGNIGIEDLLYCYLRLNSMELYELITQAFSDSCSALLAMEPC